MKEILGQIIKTKTIQHSAITLSGTIINGILGVLFFMLLARNLGPGDFGIISFSIVVITLISDIADLGINTGIINFVSKNWNSDQNKVAQFLKLALESKIVIWITTLIVGWLIMPYVASSILLKPELITPLRISLFGVGGAMLFSFITNSLQATQRFKLWSGLNISLNALRLLALVFLIAFYSLNIINSLTIYISITFLGFILGLSFLPKNFFLVKDEKLRIGEFFHFNKWVALTIFLSAISSRLDSLLLSRFVNFNDLGVYSVANQLTSYVPQLSSAIAFVVAPKFGSFTNKVDAYSYFKKLQLLCLGLGLLGLLAIPIAWILIPAFYGASFQGSSLIFALLFVGQILFFISTPAHQAMYYYFSKSNTAFWITLITFLVSLFTIWYFISTQGILGAAIGVLITFLVNFVISTLWVQKKFSES